MKPQKIGLTVLLFVTTFALLGVGRAFALPQLAPIPNQVRIMDQATDAIEILNVGGGTPGGFLSGGSSNPALVPNANIFFGNVNAQQYVTVTPVFGQTGTATITVTNSEAGDTTNRSFTVTVNPVPAGYTRFTSASAITINASGTATPYPATMSVSGMVGVITNLTLTLDKFTHANVKDVAMLLVAPSGKGVVVFANVVGDIPSGNLSNNTVRVNLEDAAPYPLPDAFQLWPEPLRPIANTPPVFPSLPGGVVVAPSAALANFNGESANGTWSLYVYDDQAGNAGSITGGWSLRIGTGVAPASAPPTISAIPNQTVLVGRSAGPFNFTVADADTPVGNLTTSGLSSNTGLVPNANIVFFNINGTTRTLTVTPVDGQFGSSTITVSVNDGTGNITSSNFTFTVSAPPAGTVIVNNASTITIPNAAAATTYPSVLNVSGVSGNITKVTLTLKGVTHTASQDMEMMLVSPTGQKAVLLAHVGVGAINNIPVTLDDAATYPLPPSCCAILAGTYQPTDLAHGPFPSPAPAGPYGATMATFNGVSPNGNWSLYVFNDPTGTGSGSISGGWSLAITTAVVGTGPTISDIPDQPPIAVNTSTGPIPFTVGDPNTALNLLTFTTNSSNLALVPLSGITLGGSLANRTVTVTPAAGQTGTSTITVTVSDGVDSATDTFLVTVGAASAPPTISAIPNQTVLVGRSAGPFNFTVADADTPVGNLTTTGLSSNTGLVPNANIVFFNINGTTRTLTVTPVDGQFGSSTITVSVNDGTGNITSSNFTFTVSAPPAGTVIVNNASTITIPNAAAATTYPSVLNVSGVSGNITKVTLTLKGVTHTASQDMEMMLVSPTGQKAVLLAHVGVGAINNIPVTLDDAATYPLPPSCCAILAGTYQPTDLAHGPFPSPAPAGPYGTTLATFNGVSPNGAWSLYVFDDPAGTGSGSISGGWSLAVTTDTAPPNTPPTISDITPKSTPMNTATAAIPFTVGDAETAAGSLTVSGDSSNPTLVPVGNIAFGGSGPNRTVTVTPAAGQTGTSTITVTVSDGPNSTSDTFLLTVGNTQLTVTGVTAANKAYDGTATATLNTAGATLVGVASGDDVTLVPAGVTGTKSVTNLTVISGLSIPPAAATPYPSTIDMTGMGGAITAVTVTLRNLTHTWTRDLDIMLVGPTGQAVMLQSDAGGTNNLGAVNNITYTLSDGAASALPNGTTALASGTYRPGNYVDASAGGDNFPSPAPAGPAATLSVFNGTAANGTWSLYVRDDGNNDVGSFAGGWSLTVTTAGGGTGVFANENVGNGKTVTVSGLTLSGTDAGNYTLVQPTTTANITPKGLTVTGITAADKVYDNTTTATLSTGSAVLVGVLGGDVATLGTGSATGAFANEAVGTSKVVQVAGLTLSGVDAGNYTLTQPTTTASITAKGLTVTGITANNKPYDGTTVAALNVGGAGLATVLGGDTVTLNTGTATGTFSSGSVGSGKLVTVSGLTIGGADAGNYTLTQPTTIANITVKPVTPVITANDKPYDGNTTATLSGQSVTGTIGGEVVTLGVGAANFVNKNAGIGKTVTATTLTLGGADAGNYVLGAASATDVANITAKAVTPVIAANDKAYDGNTTAALSSQTVTGAIGADVVTLGVGAANFDTKSVGTGKTVTATTLSLGGADGGNYVLGAASATDQANITAKTVTPVIVASNKAYDGNTTATCSQSVTGTIGADVVTLGLGAANFDTKSVGTGKTVTATTLTLGGADAGNYALGAASATDQADITAKTVTPVIVANDKAYDGNTTATLGSQTVTGAIGADVVTLGVGAANFDTKNVGINKTVTATTLSLGGVDAGNYVLGAPSATDQAAISKVGLTVTADDKSRAYGVANPALTGTLAGVQGGDNITATYTTTANVSSPVGTYAIVPVLSDPAGDVGNYNVTSNNGLLTITKAPAALTLGSLQPVYDGTGKSVTTATAPDGLTVNVTYDGNPAAPTNIGSYLVVATIVDANYQGAVTNMMTITKAALTVTGITANKVYNGTSTATLNMIAAALVGVMGDDVVTLSAAGASGTFDNETVGEDKPVQVVGLTIGGADAGNYSLTQPTLQANITAAELTVNGITAGDKVYNGNTVATINVAAAALVGVIGDDVVTLNTAGAGGAFDTPTVGNGKTVQLAGLTIGGADAGNYALTQPTASANVTKAGLTVIADSQSRVYGTANPVLTGTLNGVQGGDNITATYTTAATPASPVGNYAITSLLQDPAGKLGNYTVTAINGFLTIIKAPATVTLGSLSAVYDGTAKSPTTVTVPAGLAVNLTYNGNAAAPSNAGSYLVVATIVDANYEGVVTGTLLITKAGLTVTADNKSRAYGAANPAPTTTITGFVNGETLATSGVTGSPAVSTTAIAASPVGSYPITAAVGTLAAGNYSFSFVAGTLTVTKAGLTMAADDKSRAYRAANPELTGTLLGVQNGDDITATYTTAANASSTVGAYAIVPIPNDPGNKLGNYSLTTIIGVLTITKVPATVTPDNKSRAPGVANPVLTGTVTGFNSADNITITYSTPANVSSPVGTYPILPIIQDPDGKLGNYSLTASIGVLTIGVIDEQPRILSLTVGGPTSVVINWSAISNVTYRVQYRSDLNSGNWVDLVPDVTATTSSASAVDNPAGAKQRFYRILGLP